VGVLGEANFHEKALFVKPTWRLLAVERNDSVSFAMLPSALLMSPLLSDSVHCEILLFGLLRRRCNLRSGLASSQRVDQVRIAQSPYARDPKRSDTKEPYVSL
jgi:hypothetical protein